MVAYSENQNDQQRANNNEAVVEVTDSDYREPAKSIVSNGSGSSSKADSRAKRKQQGNAK